MSQLSFGSYGLQLPYISHLTVTSYTVKSRSTASTTPTSMTWWSAIKDYLLVFKQSLTQSGSCVSIFHYAPYGICKWQFSQCWATPLSFSEWPWLALLLATKHGQALLSILTSLALMTKLLWRPPLLALNSVTNTMALPTSLYPKKLPSRDTPCFLNPKDPKARHSKIYRYLTKQSYTFKMQAHTTNDMLKLVSSASLIWSDTSEICESST